MAPGGAKSVLAVYWVKKRHKSVPSMVKKKSHNGKTIRARRASAPAGNLRTAPGVVALLIRTRLVPSRGGYRDLWEIDGCRFGDSGIVVFLLYCVVFHPIFFEYLGAFPLAFLSSIPRLEHVRLCPEKAAEAA